MSGNPASEKVLIAGGGIAGLALALALSRRGVPSHVFERRAQFSEAGAGIQIGPNGVRALEALGIREAMEAVAGLPQEIRVHTGATGRLLQRLPLGDWIRERHGAPYLVAHRRDLQAALLAAIETQSSASSPIEVTNGVEIADFTIDEGATAGAITVDAGFAQLQGAALIAADGLHSQLRQNLFPGTAPKFAGRVAARTVIPAVEVKTLPTDATGVWLAPHSHVVHYPVRKGQEIAVVVVTTEAEWQEPVWSAEVPSGRMQEILGGFAPELRSSLDRAVEWRRWALFEAPELRNWSKGRVAVIGDAAHPILPFLAQGGCMALEDALVLAEAISATPKDIPAALRAFDHARRARDYRVVRASKRNGQIYHLAGIAGAARDAALKVLPAKRVMAGYDWIYQWQPPSVTRRRT